ncbi:LOW QUALITY PROTEIN: uncharacterized protein LOC127536032 [Acanthochromis polyacanthus]|uniref:LOW QUALITY PROTEIN: uncharacterized protein LOC127536032 n=1 Tax=Acanthochromis polyacanthus TaxID=80966 RepID=UPI0022349C94|nr:LOW QUALITY PROTEIN: uncharacterized protein LOC127536032 [Acanthochromis polyacanthus]
MHHSIFQLTEGHDVQHCTTGCKLDYVLDTEGPQTELILKTGKSCLTRGDFRTLGLTLEMESTIGNACFELIEKIAQSKGKYIFVADLYVVPTWRQPTACNPLSSFPLSITTGFNEECSLVCFFVSFNLFFVIRETFTLGTPLLSLCGKADISCCLNLSQSIHPGPWKETIGLDIQGFPRQLYGNDCGIFMLMYALYTVLNAPFDFTVMDMPSLRKWWCVMLMENFDLGSHGKMFAHWTDNSKALL